MYFEYKDNNRNVLIDLDKVAKVSLDHSDNRISFTLNGNYEAIYCNDEAEVKALHIKNI